MQGIFEFIVRSSWFIENRGQRTEGGRQKTGDGRESVYQVIRWQDTRRSGYQDIKV
jgi:hypothetical protein